MAETKKSKKEKYGDGQIFMDLTFVISILAVLEDKLMNLPEPENGAEPYLYSLAREARLKVKTIDDYLLQPKEA